MIGPSSTASVGWSASHPNFAIAVDQSRHRRCKPAIAGRSKSWNTTVTRNRRKKILPANQKRQIFGSKNGVTGLQQIDGPTIGEFAQAFNLGPDRPAAEYVTIESIRQFPSPQSPPRTMHPLTRGAYHDVVRTATSLRVSPRRRSSKCESSECEIVAACDTT